MSEYETSEHEMDERSAESPASEIRGMTEAFRLASRVKAPLRDLMKSLRLERGQLLGSSKKRIDSLQMKMLGISLLFLCPGMVLAALVEWGSSTSHGEVALLASAAICGGLGLGLWFYSSTPKEYSGTEFSARSTVFATVAWTWLICSVVGALPYVLDASVFGWSGWDSALFESVSGFSCTGATVLADIEQHGRGMLMWRQITQWYGGMGMVVLAVSVLPRLRVGGLELIGAEAPGDSDRLEPRVKQTARWLWYLYCGFTGAIALLLFAVPGPSLYDSVAHAFSTAAIGGFSPYNSSIGYFGSVWVELVIAAGLLVCAVNFAIHHQAVRGDFKPYAKSADLRFFFKALGGVFLLAWCLNVWWGGAGWAVSLRDSFFSVVSMGTSGGFANAREGGIGDFALWIPATQMLLLGLMVMGGNVGSTSGGLKVYRVRIATNHIWRNIRQTLQPHAVIPIRSGTDIVPEETVRRVLGYTTLFVVFIAAGTTLIAASGADILTSLSGVISAMSNMGPALGEAGPTSNFLEFTRPARLLLSALMLVGRLEIVAVLLMFAPVAAKLRRG